MILGSGHPTVTTILRSCMSWFNGVLAFEGLSLWRKEGQEEKGFV